MRIYPVAVLHKRYEVGEFMNERYKKCKWVQRAVDTDPMVF